MRDLPSLEVLVQQEAMHAASMFLDSPHGTVSATVVGYAEVEHW